MARSRRTGRDKIRETLKQEADQDHFKSVGTFVTNGELVRVTRTDPVEADARELVRLWNRSDGTDRLEEIKKELALRWRIGRNNALAIGGLFREARQILPHGQFRPWCEELNLYGHSAISAYMQVHRYCVGRPELAEAISVTKLQIICAPNFPEDLRETIFDAGSCSGTTERLKEVAQRVRAGELRRDSPEVQWLLQDAERPGIEEAMNRVCGSLMIQAQHTREELRKILARAPDAPDPEAGIATDLRRRIGAVEKLIVRLGG